MPPELEQQAVVRIVPAVVHGRVLVRPAAGSRRWLVGFHGYGQNAAQFLDTLRRIPGAADWLIVSIQALHPFYNSRGNEVIASWMTRQDREHAIEDNVAYVDEALAQLSREYGDPQAVVFAGFSQGVAMAYRAAILGARPGHAVLAVGGDVPPELKAERQRRWPTVVLCAGSLDTYFTPSRYGDDLAFLESLGIDVRGMAFEGGHEWNAAVDAAAGELLAQVERAS